MLVFMLMPIGSLFGVGSYTLTINSTDGGEVTAPGEGDFVRDEETVVDLVATIMGPFVFTGWTGDTGTIADVTSATTTIVMSGDYTITANFEFDVTSFDCYVDITKNLTSAHDEDLTFDFEILGTHDTKSDILETVSVTVEANQTSAVKTFGPWAAVGYDFVVTEVNIPDGWELESSSDTEYRFFVGDEPEDFIATPTFINSPITEEEKPKTSAPPEEPAPWVRDRDMTCFQVWINEDNNFEFVFWWVYADNNHVQIYDMAENLVWETDFEKEKPHFEVDLPDGMYTVNTFHEEGHILQEFVIGKP